MGGLQTHKTTHNAAGKIIGTHRRIKSNSRKTYFTTGTGQFPKQMPTLDSLLLLSRQKNDKSVSGMIRNLSASELNALLGELGKEYKGYSLASFDPAHARVGRLLSIRLAEITDDIHHIPKILKK